MTYSSENLKLTDTEMSPINKYPYSQKPNYNGTETLYDDNEHIDSYIMYRRMSSNSPFLKNNGAEAPKGPTPIVFKKWRDTRTFYNLKSTHCTLLIFLIINLVTKKKFVYSI